jgi:hypothetical protein
MTYKGILNGTTIELEEPPPYPEGQPVTVSVTPLPGRLRPGSPAAILEVVRSLPLLPKEDIEALERAIEEAHLPMSAAGIFDEEG